MSKVAASTLTLAQVAERQRVLASRLKAASQIPARICNSTSRAGYFGPAWSAARPEGDAFLNIKSRGF